MSAPAVAPLVSDVEQTVTLAGGADRTFTWQPGGNATRVRLSLIADNECHGCPWRAVIECDAPDTGSLTVPRAMIEAFPETHPFCAGSDCPTSSLARYARTTAAVPGGGRVALEVASEAVFWLERAAP